MKKIRIVLEDRRIYDLPLSVVADIRAKHYAEKDPDTTYQQEYDYVMNDDYEGLDWFQNNMNLRDVVSHLVEVPVIPEPYKPLEKCFDYNSDLIDD